MTKSLAKCVRHPAPGGIASEVDGSAEPLYRPRDFPNVGSTAIVVGFVAVPGEAAMTAWKPPGYPSMSPYLICEDAEVLIRFLQGAFGGILLRRFDRADGSLMHAELRIDDGIVMVGGGVTDARSTAPHIHLYVPDAAAAYARAIAAGATAIQEPARNREDDDLRGGVRDPSGTTWWLASR